MPEIRDLISQRNLSGPIPALTSVIGLILPCVGVHDGYRSADPVKKDTIAWVPAHEHRVWIYFRD